MEQLFGGGILWTLLIGFVCGLLARVLRLAQLIDSPRPSTSRLGRYAQDERGSQMPLILSVGREEAEVEGRPVSRQPFTQSSIPG
jgi:hypothetical protein